MYLFSPLLLLLILLLLLFRHYYSCFFLNIPISAVEGSGLERDT
jgi:hypothetical protein